MKCVQKLSSGDGGSWGGVVSIRPLRIAPEPVDEVTCRFDVTGQIVVVFDDFPGRNNAYIYSIGG